MLAIVIVLSIALFVGLREWHSRARSRVLGEIFDLADALEAELLECRARLREVPGLTNLLPGSGELAANATLAAEPQVQEALRDLLAHRLWLKDHAQTASHAELVAARDALAATRRSLATQLTRLAKVRDELAQSRADQAARR